MIDQTLQRNQDLTKHRRHHERNQNQEAIKDFDKAIELDPNKSDAYIQRGFAKMHNKDYLGVLLDENKLKEIIPNFSFGNIMVCVTIPSKPPV